MNKIQKRLNIAISNERIEDLRALLEQGADPNGLDHKGWTPLMAAVEHENIEIIQLLLSYGAEINRKDEHGQTPLHIAVDISIDGTIQSGGKQGDEPTDTILYLLENGAAPDARNTEGKTPLDWAREYKSEKILKLLQEHKS